MATDKEAIAEEYISSLQNRIAILEQRLIGDEKIREGQPPLLHLLKTIDRKLKALAEPDIVHAVWSQVPELEKVLDPNYATAFKLNDSAKQELLLCYADQLQKYQQDIEDLLFLKDSLNSSSFQGLGAEEKTLSKIASGHIQQETEVAELTSHVHKFIDSYTKFLLQLSAQCVQWDEIVTQLETAK